MEAVVNLKFARVLANSVPGRLHQEYAVINYGTLGWLEHSNCHYYCLPQKREVRFRSVRTDIAVTAFQGKHGASDISPESTSFENRPQDYGKVNTLAEIPRVHQNMQRARVGMGSLKLEGLEADQDSPKATYKRSGHRSAKDSRVEGKGCNSFVEDGEATKGPYADWAILAGAGRPLTTDEERSLSADVQDMLSLERRKKELEEMLGREPTVDEWATHCTISIFKLYARIGKGRAAKRKMIAANLPLVNSVAHQFHGRGLSHWELCQEGVQGLERSAEKYNTCHNTKFSSYSFLWIWERMSAGVKKFRHVLRISRTVYKMASTILKSKEEFQMEHGRPPSLEELADLSHIDADKIRNVARLVKPAKSMDEAVSTLEGDYKKEVEDQSLGRVPWVHIMESELKAEVAKALQSLTSREQMVLEMRYGLCGEPPKRRAQVALTLDLTYESIRLTEKKALDKLQHLAKEDGLQQYLSGSMWVQ